MSFGFIFLFFEFTRLSSDAALQSTVKISPQILTTSALKVGFTPTNAPKLFAVDPTLSDGLVLGYAEAKMMKDEGLFNQVGDHLTNFFGLPDVTIVGIAAKTDTPSDHFHYFDPVTFAKLSGQDNLFIAVAPDKSLKLFFVDDATPSVTLGFSEAQMMIKEKLIARQGSQLANFFGNPSVTIQKINYRTDTSADMFHYVSTEFKDNYQKL